MVDFTSMKIIATMDGHRGFTFNSEFSIFFVESMWKFYQSDTGTDHENVLSMVCLHKSHKR